MKLATRLGVFTTAVLMACGSVSAAHATVEKPPEGAPLEVSATSSETSFSDGQTPDYSQMPPLSCTGHVDETKVTIRFVTSADFDEITVTAAGEEVVREQVSQTSQVVVDRADATAIMLVTLWEDNSLVDECEVETQLPLSPSPEESAPTSPSPTEPDESHEPTDPEPTTPTPTPSSTTSSPADPPPSPPLMTPPSSSPTGQNSRPQQSPDLSNPRTPQQRTETPSESADQPLPPNFRRYSDSPRYLLPQLFGINSRLGSPLIMPSPRDREQQQADLETLPPVSQDELDAIKSQLSSPGRADRSTTSDELQGAAIDERVADQNSWWLIIGMTAVVCVSAGAWWALNKRKRNH